jgi:3-hydroxybutyryl-CoA dehydrogenase
MVTGEVAMKAPDIQKVAVLGLGRMGHGIAQAFAVGGCDVRCYDQMEEVLQSTVSRIRDNLETANGAGIIPPGGVDVALSRIIICDSEEEALAEAEFVTEVVAEDLAIKQELFARIEGVVSTECILASNTSTWPMTSMSARMKHPERAINTHWFNPPHIVPLVEVIPGEKTAEVITERTSATIEHLGKTVVCLRKELPGFLVNRVQAAMYREILDLLERDVASAEDIDRALRASVGFRLAAIGPLLVYDFAGVDMQARVYAQLVESIRSDRQVHDLVKGLIARGHLGPKAGKGIFDYTPESAEKIQEQRDRRYLELLKLFYSDSSS